jgi:hypothetical protein
MVEQVHWQALALPKGGPPTRCCMMLAYPTVRCYYCYHGHKQEE